MTPEAAAELIAAGENLDVEFKGEGRQQLSDTELLEAVICLANRPGREPGWLFVGVEDDGTISGARPRHEGGLIDPLRVQALIANRTRPVLTVRVELLRLQDRPVIAVEVPPSRTPLGTSDGKYLRRALGGDGRPACLPFHFHEMQSWQADRGVLDYSALVLPGVAWSDLDPLEFERYRRAIRESRGRGDEALLELSDLELAKALGAVEANHEVRGVRVLGLLLFGREDAIRRALPTHEVAFQELAGLTVEVNDFFRWPLLRVLEELEARFRARNKEQEISLGLLRVGVPDYPPRAFREGMANALIHRDYTRTGAVHVQWYVDRIEIASPGGFPEGVRLGNLLVTPPIPRNPLLADALKRAGVVERTARGIDTIFYEQLRGGRPAPSYERSTATGVLLTLPGGEANLEFVRIVAEAGQEGHWPTLDELLLLNALWQERSLGTARAAEIIQKGEAMARATLQKLVETGLAESRGATRARQYHLSARTYQRLGKKAAYVRQRGFEPLQQEQMVLQYVARHGRITRAETADLCHLSADQSKRLLNRLCEAGNLARYGSGRNTTYGPPGMES